MRRVAALALLGSGLFAASLPTPEAYFGHPMGADRKLIDWAKVVSYFETLDRASDRMVVENIGPTVQKRPMIAAFISSPATLKDLPRFREIQQRLADPRRTPAKDAETFIADGKVVVLITCSIHSVEVASTFTAIEFAHRMLTDDSPRTRRILDNVLLILVPSLNPDGVDIVAKWYRGTLGTPFEGTRPPELYHAYAGHDNNRDWYIFSQPETRHVVERLHNVWHPQIVYDVHQQREYGSRMFLPPWLDPVDPNIDPIIAQFCNSIGLSMAADLTAAGKKGVVVNALYDFWTPARHYQAYHGGLRILSESASVKIATPLTIAPDQIERRGLGYSPRERSWNYLEPWLGGTWRLRDIVDYQLLTFESCLFHAAVLREDMLRNFYAVGKRAVARTAPYSFVLPAGQLDPGAARKLLETLSFGQVEIEKSKTPFRAGTGEYAAGSYVIRLQQPYGSWAKTLLERQEYPDQRMYPGGPPKRPYDVTAQTLPLLMGVRVDTIESSFSATLEQTSEFSFTQPGGAPRGELAASDTDSYFAINKAWNMGQRVLRTAEGNLRADPKGSARPRIAIYQSWVPSMDEGWTRWLLDTIGFQYEIVHDPDIRRGDLRKRFDAMILPDQNAAQMFEGYRSGSMPERYTGGLGQPGVDALQEFAVHGGTLVFLNEASTFAIDYLKLPVRNVLKGLPNHEFYSPGSLLNARLVTGQPLTYGVPAEISIWSEDSPAFELPQGSTAKSLASYPDAGVLASGWLLGDKYLAGKSALVEVPMGGGRAVLFGMRPQYRAQSYQTFKLFFNALIGAAN